MRLFQRAAVSLTALAVVGVPVAVSGPAVAAPVGGQAASVAPCLTGTGLTGTGLTSTGLTSTGLTDVASRIRGKDAPKWRDYSDTSPVTKADLQALPAAQTRRRYVNRQVRPRLARRVYIPVFVHVIKGRHKGERVPTGPKRIRQLINTLNKGMAGGQSGYSVTMRFRFLLKDIDYTRRDGWYHAFLFGPRDQRMKRHLHRGNQRALNLYINGGGPTGTPVLGWARFPWQYRSTPALDSITVNVAAMRGGSARGYNRGDTVVHETGHWLGLYHTFQGGCGRYGDLVGDTPKEARPSFYCEGRRDTCASDPGFDPVRNFMDYSLDLCMNRFSAGQVRRADAAFEKWRR